MTEPVARAASPRRTVRVAAALVAGQATLCAVIGWVTFGSPQTGPPPPAAGRVAPLAVPPIVVPTASMALPPTAVPSTSTSAAAPRPKPPARAPKPPVPVSTPKPRATTEAPPPATMESPPPTTTAARSSPSVTPPDLAATAPPSPPPTVQAPVVEGEPCDPVGALGRTADDVQLRCVRGDDDRPRWEII